MGFLRLSGVDMSGGSIPTEIVTLTLLVELRLAASNLSGSIPSEIGALTDLGNLDLSVWICTIAIHVRLYLTCIAEQQVYRTATFTDRYARIDRPG